MASSSQQGAMELKLRPHKEHVAADQVSPEKVVVVNLVTAERKELDAGEAWEISYDDEGFGAYVSVNADGSSTARDLDSLFSEVYEGSDGSTWAVSPSSKKPLSIDVAMARHREAEMSLRVTATSAECKLRCAVFARPRHGMQATFISLESLYTTLRLDACQGKPYKWIARHNQQWATQQEKLFGHSQLVQGTYTTEQTTHRNALHWRERCLPVPMMSTMATFSALARWSNPVAQKGGFQNPLQREAAMMLITCFLNHAFPHDGAESEIQIEVTPHWQCRWPRPDVTLPASARTFPLHITNGRVPLRDLRAASDVAAGAGCAWWTKMVETYSHHDTLPLATLLTDSSHVPAWSTFHAQLCYRASLALQTRLATGVDERGTVQSGIRMCWRKDEFETGAKLEHKLARYVHNSRTEASGTRCFAIASDKAWCHGLPLQASIIVVPENLAIVACPVVSRLVACPIH
eukprot:1019527-Amphidinium_carterae.1